jgi:hypothetical protein
VPDEDVFALTAVERRRAADMFAGLSDGQWASASLCAEWTVRDVARPLGLDTTASPAAWRGALGFLASPRARRGFVPRGRTDGLRFRATDQDWAYGQGPAISGPSEALALAIGGRPVALDDLAGPGLPVLRGRLS